MKSQSNKISQKHCIWINVYCNFQRAAIVIFCHVSCNMYIKMQFYKLLKHIELLDKMQLSQSIIEHF